MTPQIGESKLQWWHILQPQKVDFGIVQYRGGKCSGLLIEHSFYPRARRSETPACADFEFHASSPLYREIRNRHLKRGVVA